MKKHYLVPYEVQREAQMGLEWRRTLGRGGTSVGAATARWLASGRPVTLEKIKHIAKYFPRHEVDKKAEGWRRGEEGYPSRGRIAWALWGGEAGKKWVRGILERLGHT